jgi:hypothetical protein
MEISLSAIVCLQYRLFSTKLYNFLKVFVEMDKNLHISTNSILSSVGEDQDELVNTLKIINTEVQTLED